MSPSSLQVARIKSVNSSSSSLPRLVPAPPAPPAPPAGAGAAPSAKAAAAAGAGAEPAAGTWAGAEAAAEAEAEAEVIAAPAAPAAEVRGEFGTAMILTTPMEGGTITTRSLSSASGKVMERTPLTSARASSSEKTATPVDTPLPWAIAALAASAAPGIEVRRSTGTAVKPATAAVEPGATAAGPAAAAEVLGTTAAGPATAAVGRGATAVDAAAEGLTPPLATAAKFGATPLIVTLA